ncbi:hypothetical protein PR048_021743 [Dryococelus australis]|uniref:Uncharacterized protein n=1 Tax=Dryococelus australis TaxID=614101 RepID=A0ABQ9GZ50_9NEOP|nr:hypothetical protein PR048_021743 [Dryococelus australis]
MHQMNAKSREEKIAEQQQRKNLQLEKAFFASRRIPKNELEECQEKLQDMMERQEASKKMEAAERAKLEKENPINFKFRVKLYSGVSLISKELNTILCECESLVNSRPNTITSDTNHDPLALTPSVFLQDLQHSGILDVAEIEFIINLIGKKSLDFVFFASHVHINQCILALSMVDCEMYMRCCKLDTIDVQQLEIAARDRAEKKQQKYEESLHTISEEIEKNQQNLNNAQNMIRHLVEELH